MKEKLRGLDLFSGIGGLAVALAPWVQPVAYCENEPFACGVLMSRMADGSLPAAPIWDDVTTLRGEHLPGAIDIIVGGFPCQDVSIAGAGVGVGGERTGLYREVIRLVAELRPSFVFLENTPAITRRGAHVVVGDLAGLGYDARWTSTRAKEVGAPHRRDRWWCLAADANRLAIRFESERQQREEQREAETERRHAIALDARRSWDIARASAWPASPDLRRVDDGLSAALDRHRGLGNAVVPAQARRAFCLLAGLGDV